MRPEEQKPEDRNPKSLGTIGPLLMVFIEHPNDGSPANSQC
jgi:hypothetical protein